MEVGILVFNCWSFLRTNLFLKSSGRRRVKELHGSHQAASRQNSAVVGQPQTNSWAPLTLKMNEIDF